MPKLNCGNEESSIEASATQIGSAAWTCYCQIGLSPPLSVKINQIWLNICQCLCSPSRQIGYSLALGVICHWKHNKMVHFQWIKTSMVLITYLLPSTFFSMQINVNNSQCTLKNATCRFFNCKQYLNRCKCRCQIWFTSKCKQPVRRQNPIWATSRNRASRPVVSHTTAVTRTHIKHLT